MTKPVSTLTTFAGQSGPVPLNQLDTNLSNLAATANDTLTYENYVLDTGAANAYVVTFGAGISVAYQAGLRIVFKAGASNTTASNINVNTLGAQLIVNKDGSALVANQIVAGGLATIIYNGTNFELVTPNPNVKNGAVTAPAFIPNGSTVPANGIYLPSANTLGFATNSTQWGTVNATGNWTINAPSSGNATVSITALDNTNGIDFRAPGTNGSNIRLYDTTASAPRGYIGFGASTVSGAAISDFIISSGASGTVNFAINLTVAAKIDSSGNLGLGVTPSAWSSWKALQLVGNGALAGLPAYTSLSNNWYAAPADTRIAADYATQYQQHSGQHIWNTAGTAGAGTAITWTQAMTLDTSGNLTVPAMYATTVTTPRNVFIDSTGKMGGISSVRASKSNIVPLATAAWINALNPVTFNYKKRDEAGAYLDEVEDEKQYGLIAEDVEAINPDLCVYNIVDGQKVLAGVHYDRMIAPLIKAIQELTARLAVLEAK